MNAIKSYSILMLGVVSFVFAISACGDNDFDVPLASTQARFDYTITDILIDEEEEIYHYRIDLFNKSLLATGYFWDFGNGQTSTEVSPVVTYEAAGKYTITLTVTPTNEVYYNKLVHSVSLALGKQVILYEDFSEGIDYIDEDTWAPEGWKAVDNDGDGNNWYPGLRQGVITMRSQSWDGAPLNPDNWLITPEINLLNFSTDATINLFYTAGITANTAVYRQEHYGVFVAIGNDDLSSFELVFEETFTTTTPNWIPQERNIDLKEFAGNIIYIAFRHYNVTDMDRMFIDEVEVYVIE